MKDPETVEVSVESVREALDDIREVLDERLLQEFTEVTKDSEAWSRASVLPRDYFARRGIDFPPTIEIDLNRPKVWPGRCCFKICRSVDPIPPPPEGPSGIYFCVYLCLPCRPETPPFIRPRPAAEGEIE